MATLNKFVDIAETLNRSYKVKYFGVSGKTQLDSSLKVVTTFSLEEDLNNIKLPLVCSGRLITAGEYYDGSVGEKVVLSELELKKSLSNWIVDIMKSHAATASTVRGGDVSIDHIVGKVQNAKWGDGGIDWEGFIVDEDLARKISAGLIRFGSVTFERDIQRGDDGRLYYTNIKPLDFSLVFNPKDKNASIKKGGL